MNNGNCQDKDSTGFSNREVVWTETNRDWAKDVKTETFLRVSLFTVPDEPSTNISMSVFVISSSQL